MNKKTALSAVERRSLIQLGVSLAIFALAFVGRSAFPNVVGQWNEALRYHVDLEGAFTRFGRSAAQGEPVLTAMGELCIEVLGGRETCELAMRTEPTLVQRGRFAMDKVNGWWQPEEENQEKAQLPEQTNDNEPEQALEVEKVSAAQINYAPAVVTAVAQEYDQTGQALPACVSLQNYALGLAEITAPVAGTLTSPFGYRDHPVDGDYTFHRGVDVGAKKGTPLLAFADGKVEFIGESAESGLYIQLDHGMGVKTFYAHCNDLCVAQGAEVKIGQTIGSVGETGNATGPHLHFALIKDGIYLDPLFYFSVNEP